MRHEPSFGVWDGDEVVCACDRCSASATATPPTDVVGGALFEDECPNEEPPKLTALAMTYRAQLAPAVRHAGWSDRDVTRG